VIVRSAEEFVELTLEEELATVTLSRPDRLNAASPQLVSQLLKVLEEAVVSGARVIVLRGSGRAFCAGHDLKEPALEASSEEFTNHLNNLQSITRLLRNEKLISIASIHGFALGAGLEFALSCDFIIAADDTAMGFPEVSVGLSVTGGVSFLLPQAVGMAKAKELILLSENFSASEALEMGLITYVVSQDALVDKTKQIAAKLIAQPENSLTLAKSYLEQSATKSLDSAMQVEVEAAIETVAFTESEIARKRFSNKDKS
jgi:enoyl-CoA hydratase/carnithine racemase